MLALYRHLAAMTGPNWPVSFAELEAILGFELPISARLYRAWWSNQKHGAGHSHALAWFAAGWNTRSVDLEAETLVFERVEGASDQADAAPRRRKFGLDANCGPRYPAVPGHRASPSVASRFMIEFGRLTGGPQDEARAQSLKFRMCLDTNVLVRARFEEAPSHNVARRRMQEAGESREALRISRQVLREYLATVTRLQPWSPPIAMDMALTHISPPLRPRSRFWKTAQR